ncbi:methyltransferase domain-containing protein [Candidatus Clavichlamydia salmonicola]|uniref:methyltransferase domain-containing protein n=1 Tax=Candidatus Clavichlamydia salmonicola TaxID=469812 RepID=UPI001890F552|nr:methyltransferase domain-containing protein [Candidatus Clavichlamydia salmonicola]
MGVLLYIFQLKEFFRLMIFIYPKSLSILMIDLILLVRSYFFNPYKHLQKSQYAKQTGNFYGETSLSAALTIFKKCGLLSTDVFYDLGCGQGRLCLFIHAHVQCRRVVGVDQEGEFIAFAETMKSFFFPNGEIFFECDKIEEIDLSQATFIYFYCSSFSDALIKKIANNPTINKQTKIVTTSAPLKDFGLSDSYTLTKTLPIRFPWGKTEVFVNVRR